MKLKSFCKAKDTINRTKRQPTNDERSSLFPHLTECCCPNTERTLGTRHEKKPTNNPFLKWYTVLNREFSIENSQVAENH